MYIYIYRVPKINFHYITQTKQASTVSNVNMLWVGQTEKWSLIYKNNFLYLTLDKNWELYFYKQAKVQCSLQCQPLLDKFTSLQSIH